MIAPAPSRHRAFDQDSPDAVILQAFERVQANKAWVYSFDREHQTDEVKIALDAGDAQQLQDEQQVEGNFALTPTGVFAQLALELTRDCDRWIDSDFATHGFTAIHRKLDTLPYEKKVLVEIMDQLLHMEWQAALDAYQRSEGDLSLAMEANDIAETIGGKLAAASAVADPDQCRVFRLAEDMLNRFGNMRQLQRLVRTLAPDQHAFRRKVEIIEAEKYVESDVVQWLARDTHFLIGNGDAA